jgi:hypothetical protein
MYKGTQITSVRLDPHLRLRAELIVVQRRKKKRTASYTLTDFINQAVNDLIRKLDRSQEYHESRIFLK